MNLLKLFFDPGLMVVTIGSLLLFVLTKTPLGEAILGTAVIYLACLSLLIARRAGK